MENKPELVIIQQAFMVEDVGIELSTTAICGIEVLRSTCIFSGVIETNTNPKMKSFLKLSSELAYDFFQTTASKENIHKIFTQ